LVDKEERIQGGNRVVSLTYELTVENFGGEPADVRLFDRMPTTESSDVKVMLAENGQEISNDAAYQMRDRKEGLLRWDVSVPAGAIGPQCYAQKYTLQLEYDKQLSIAARPASRQ
jgi:hypothetical protein